jgi:hypothetical protein
MNTEIENAIKSAFKNKLESAKLAYNNFLEDNERIRKIIDEAFGSALWNVSNEFEVELDGDIQDYDCEELFHNGVDELQEIVEKNFAALEHSDDKALFYELFSEVSGDHYPHELDKNIDIFVAFVKALHEHFDMNAGSVNVWHIEQNSLKNQTDGKKSIAELCYSYFTSFMAYKDK